MSILVTTLNKGEWIDRFDAEKTRLQAHFSLTSFQKFIKSEYKHTEKEIIDELKTSPNDAKYIFLQKLIRYWAKNNLSPATMSNYFVFIRNYLRFQGVKTTREEVKDLIQFPKQVKEIRQPITTDMFKEILIASHNKYKALFLILGSSGMRIGETLNLRIKDVDLNLDPVRIHLSPKITKTVQGRETYISQEALEALKKIMNKSNPEGRLLDIEYGAAQRYIHYVRVKTGFIAKYSNEKNYQVNIHAFRAFFFTQATLKHGGDYAHAVTGHGAYLAQYLRIPPETREKMYKELEPNVTISSDIRLTNENKVLQKQLTRQEYLEKELIELQAKMKRIEQMNQKIS